jgi:aryl-alcohol dehydrogenase-like predicted oxidoreductase
MTDQAGTQASQDDDYEFPGLPASPALDEHYEASQAIVNDACRQGTPTRTRKIFPGAFSDITYAEPLAGIKLAQARRSAANRVVSDYIKYAREDGAGWREIGNAMGLERAAEETGYDLAELAFQQATGQRAAVRPAGPAQAGNRGQPAQAGSRPSRCGQLAPDGRRRARPPFDDQLAAMVKARDEPRAWRSEIAGRRITLVNCSRKGVMSMTSRSTPRYVLGTATVSRVGFGAMQLPGPGVFGPPRDRDEAIAVLRRAVELGVDHIDTAQYYGPDVANELIRAALYPYPEGLALVSKVGARRDESGGVLRYDQPAQLRQGIEDNLRSLAVGHLAAVNLRLMDDAEPDQRFDDQLAAMVKARDNGLIGGVGLSNVTRDHLLHALSVTDIACVQNPMNLADRASMPVLEECYAHGIAFVPFFPLGSAFTQGNPVLGSPQVIRTVARLSHTPAQVALAWLLSLRPNVLLIPGTSSIRHLQENMAVANIELDTEARELLAPVA